jgi:hypothetical protein
MGADCVIATIAMASQRLLAAAVAGCLELLE